MSASSVVGSNEQTPKPLGFEPKTCLFGMTTAKIMKIALIALAIFVGLAGACFLVLPLVTKLALPLFVAIPLLSTSALAIWQVTRIVDYNDPSQIQKFREEAKELTLYEIYQQHGAYMFSRGIPHPDDFGGKYVHELTRDLLLPDESDEQEPLREVSLPFSQAISRHLSWHSAWEDSHVSDLEFPHVSTPMAPSFLDTAWAKVKTEENIVELCECDPSALHEAGYITEAQKIALKPLFSRFFEAEQDERVSLIPQILAILN